MPTSDRLRIAADTIRQTLPGCVPEGHLEDLQWVAVLPAHGSGGATIPEAQASEVRVRGKWQLKIDGFAALLEADDATRLCDALVAAGVPVYRAAIPGVTVSSWPGDGKQVALEVDGRTYGVRREPKTAFSGVCDEFVVLNEARATVARFCFIAGDPTAFVDSPLAHDVVRQLRSVGLLS